MTVLVGAAELLAAPVRPVLLDVRWALGDDRGRERYLAGHLPGAVFADLDTELAAPASPGEGRHPLPSVADLQAAARRWGIRTGDAVVAYDATGGLAAARAWWLLRWGGLGDVRLLDGGVDAWWPRAGASRPVTSSRSPATWCCPAPGCRCSPPPRRPRCPGPAACCSPPGRGSATAARPSRSTRAPATCRVR